MNRLLVALGVLCLVGFVAVWLPAGLLFAGLLCIGLARARAANREGR